jgi:geranylgeranyl diphosphate synthase type II
MFDLSAYLEKRRQKVEAGLSKHLPPASTRPAILHEAMRYAVLGGGKRLRPILCMTSCEAAGGHPENALLPGLAIEILHTYTLIHDDLPCMDDDDLRRGRPTTHMKYGEANALLAGDALLTLAFEWTAKVPAPPPYSPGQLSLELAIGAGSQGVIGGQVEDLAAEGQPVNADLVDYIHRHKTASLIRSATRMGAICAGATPPQLEALSRYGECIGLAFQIADDILNVTSTPEQLGKPVGNDVALTKLTYVAVHGMEPSQIRANALIEEAISAVQILPGDNSPLVELARYTVKRNK